MCRRARRLHTGAITVPEPDTLWATDATEAQTALERRCAVFAVVDHATGEAWVDASPRMDRFAAADLLRCRWVLRAGYQRLQKRQHDHDYHGGGRNGTNGRDRS